MLFTFALGCVLFSSGQIDLIVEEDCVEQSYFSDSDADGLGDPTSAIDACQAPEGTVDNADDCNDSDATQPLQDGDCDGTLTEDDCDDSDAAIGFDPDDLDCDGVPANEDCDDSDPLLNAIANDSDCDGAPTEDDCNDATTDLVSVYDDADCDGLRNDIDPICDGLITIEGPRSSDLLRRYDICEEVMGDIIVHADALTALNSFNSLVTLHGSLHILSNVQSPTVIEEIDGFAVLTLITGDLFIQNNEQLQSIAGFPQLSSVHDLSITDNVSLANVSAFGSLETVSGSIDLQNNIALTSFNLPMLQLVEQGMTIAHNDLSQGLGPFENLEFLYGSLILLGNEGLTTIDGFPDLLVIKEARSSTSINQSMQGYLWIIDNRTLISITGFTQLSDIQNSLELRDNIQLDTIDGWNTLQSIGGDLVVSGNHQLCPEAELPFFPQNITFGQIIIEANAPDTQCSAQ